MAPTTDMGNNHQMIDYDIQHRESLKYGNLASSTDQSQLLPKLNDISYHRVSQRNRGSFNVITGTYKQKA